MILRGIFCVWAATTGSSAFAPTTKTTTSNAAAVLIGSRDRITRTRSRAVADATTTSSTETASSSPPVSSTASSSSSSSVLRHFDHHESTRLPYSPTGYSTWEWKTHHNPQNQQAENNEGSTTTHSINYLEMGNDDDEDTAKPAIVLIHGFGASSYHYRYNVPILARRYRVYALDLLGFGWSDKPIMDYDASVWRDQVVDFVREVVWKDDDGEEKVVDKVNGEEEEEQRSKEKSQVAIAGNSLGGYTAMYASSDERIKEHVSGCILLNAAGKFRDPQEAEEKKGEEPNPVVQSISAAIQRFVIACSFVITKQPLRIEQILKQVYPINGDNVDSELVESIRTPALDPTAAEVFYRVIAKNGKGPQAYVDDILKELHCPVLLAWGESDPWIQSAAADRMERLHAEFHGLSSDNDSENVGDRWIRRTSIDAGHCPHDEDPEAVNEAILDFVDEVMSF